MRTCCLSGTARVRSIRMSKNYLAIKLTQGVLQSVTQIKRNRSEGGGVKRKSQTPGFHDKTRTKTKKPKKLCTESSPQIVHDTNLNELKNQLGNIKLSNQSRC